MGIESVWWRHRQIREVDKRRWDALIKQVRKMARDGEDDLGANFVCMCVL